MKIGHQEINKLKLVVLSPVHIGTGEEIEPLEYVIKDKKFYRINFVKFMDLLSQNEKKKLGDMVRYSSVRTIMSVRTFIRDKFSPESMGDCIIENFDVDDYLDIEYNKLLDEFANKDPKNTQINQLSIMELYRSGNAPVIPGSSLKGSIRTAILDKLLKNDKNKKYSLDSFKGKSDPFDSLRISDFVRGKSDPGISIGYFVNAPRDRFDEVAFKENLSVMCECLSIGKAYRGDIRSVVNDNLLVKDDNSFFRPLRDLISSLDEIFKTCNEHYLPILNNELKLINNPKQENNFANYLLNKGYLNDIKDNKIALLRIGMHSGAEAVTIEGRKIDIKKKKDTVVQGLPTTTWYFSKKSKPKNKDDLKEMFPCGWVILKRDEYVDK